MKALLFIWLVFISMDGFTQNNLGTPVLFINELLSSNNTYEDEFGEKDDWIEIYNPNNFPVDVAGMYISDKEDNPTKYQFPNGDDVTIIPANGFLLVWADEQSFQGALHTNFKLSNDGEYVGLTNTDGTTLIDGIAFGVQVQNVSYGRQNDGELPWVNFNEPTPNASNSGITSVPLIQNKPAFTLFPNPSSDFIYFSEPMRFSIFDVTGIEVVRTNQPIQAWDISQLQNGFYHIRSETGQVVRFIKQ